MKTEDVRMTEVALGPFTTLILFSAPERSRAASLPLNSIGDAAVFTAAMLREPAWHDRRRCTAALQEV